MVRRPTEPRPARIARPAIGAAPMAALVALIATLAPTPGVPAWADTERLGDGATATAPDRVLVGGVIEISGTGWVLPAKARSDGGGSVIAVRFDDGAVGASGPVANPATGGPVGDPTVVAAVRATGSGAFRLAVPVPKGPGWTVGTGHSVRLVSGRLLNDDATRSIALTFDIVADAPSPTPSSPSSPAADPTPRNAPTATGQSTVGPTPASTLSPIPSASSRPDRTPGPSASTARPQGSVASTPTPGATKDSSGASAGVRSRSGSTDRDATGPTPDPTASSDPAVPGPNPPGSSASESAAAGCQAEPVAALSGGVSVRGVPTQRAGGTLRLTGTGFCHPGGGGSMVAVQIDDGRLGRVESPIQSDPTVWQLIQAEPDGSFVTAVQLPQEHQTQPAFAAGPHRLRLVTGPFRTGDATRAVPTGEFVITAGGGDQVLPAPTSRPRPVTPEVSLVASKAGTVRAASSGSTVRLSVPELEPGDWVYPYAFDGRDDDGAGRPTDWVQLDASRSAVLDLAELTAAGTTITRVSVQARDGSLVGWAPLVASNSGPGLPEPPPAAGKAEPPTPGEHGPRPLRLLVAGALLLVGLGLLQVSRHRRLARISELNGR